MNVQTVCNLFRYRQAVKNFQKTCVANACLNRGQGTMLVRRIRKYRRPEDLEDPFYYGVGPKQKFEYVCQSLKTRGFGKELQSYNPPPDVQEQFQKLCQKVFGSQLKSDWKSQSLNDRVMKYKLLTEAIKLFHKDIPNTELHKMKEVKDVHEFFCTPLDGSYHYDSLLQRKNELPPNLQVLPEAPRFDPSSDTFFDGITAFPHRKRIIHTKAGEKFEKIIEWPHV